MRVKKLVLGIIFTLTSLSVWPQSNIGSSVSIFEISKFKIAKGYKNYLGAQEGEYTCWANVIETIYKVQGEPIDERDIILSGILYSRGVLVSDSEYLNFIDTTNATIPRFSYLQMLSGRSTMISSDDVEVNIDRDYVIIYASNGHTSFIVGYSREYYLALNSFQGKFEKIPKAVLKSHSPMIDPEPPIFLTVNHQLPNIIKIGKHP